MKLQIELPEPDEILKQGCPVPIARQKESWSPTCLGKMAKERGVYVIHHAGIILYVGKTDGPAMNFGRRLRAEFRELSSRDRHIYPKLSTLQVLPNIMVHCFTVSDIKKRVKTDGRQFKSFQLIGIFETAMICHLEPSFQQHHIKATAQRIEKIFRKNMKIELSVENRQALKELVAKNLK
jgi:hypothetical protein